MQNANPRPARFNDPYVTPSEITFEVTEAIEGGYNARALGYGIFTQAEDWDELKEMVVEASECYFEDGCAPSVVRLRMARIAL